MEDDAAISDFIVGILRKNNYVVKKASDAKEASEIYKKEKSGFDMVFSDVILPDKNGLQVVAQLHKYNPALKVLLSSGYIDYTPQIDIINKKGYKFLPKPYSISKLLKTIKDILTQKQ